MSENKPAALFRQSLKDYRANLRTLLWVVLVVAIPADLITTFAIDTNSDTTSSAYITFAQLAMNVALIYAVVNIVEGKTVQARQAYYDGSAMLIRLFLVSLLLVLMLLPLVLGLLIVGAGVVAPGVVLSWPERVLLIALAILVSVPSFILIARGFWALYVIYETPLGPIEAVRRSRTLTKGAVQRTLQRMVALVGLLILLLVVPVGLLGLGYALTSWGIWKFLVEVLITATVLPISNLYLYRYYRSLAA